MILDIIYNHAGGGFDDNSMWFLDRMPFGNANDSLHFTDQGWAGGEVFADWNNDVKQFLIDNARFYYEEYRIDGFRFDERSGFGEIRFPKSIRRLHAWNTFDGTLFQVAS